MQWCSYPVLRQTLRAQTGALWHPIKEGANVVNDETVEEVQEELAFRVKALVRWGFCRTLPFVSDEYRRAAADEMDAIVLSEWEFVANSLGHILHSLSFSLPPDDRFRSIDAGTQLTPEIGMDILYPTQEDLTLDPDFVPSSTPAAANTAMLLAAAASDQDGAGAVRAIYDLAGGDRFDQRPPVEEAQRRRDAVAAASDALRLLMWRRQGYLQADDPAGNRALLVWAVVIDRRLPHDRGEGAVRGRFFTDVLEQQEAELAIDRMF